MDQPLVRQQAPPDAPAPRRPSRAMAILATAVGRGIKRGELTIIDHQGLGHHCGRPENDRQPSVIRLKDSRVPAEILRNPILGLGEGYMDGRIVVEAGDILDLLDLIGANSPWEETGARPSRFRDFLARLDRINWERRAKRNVAHHYDLSDRLYETFLDDDLQYSCAYFRQPNNSLEEAQADKKAHIAAKLLLQRGQSVLDIGCGWGGLALYLNRVADVDVLGVTLSEHQLRVARRRAEEAGVADRVRFELLDYRRVPGSFDRIVSVGMFEHVGPVHYRSFFAKCRSLLREDGVMLLHTIGCLGVPGTTDSWTRKYIFPGGYSPSLSEIVSASEEARLIAADVETLRLHYGQTLDIWYRRAGERRADLEALYDARFFRMWQFYLAGSSAAFKYGGMCNYQIQYIRDRRALPITRDYMQDVEKALREEAIASAMPG